jgi:hypothetical protein
MPYKSKAQHRLFRRLEALGLLPPGTASAWAHETPSLSKLPDKVNDSPKKQKDENLKKVAILLKTATANGNEAEILTQLILKSRESQRKRAGWDKWLDYCLIEQLIIRKRAMDNIARKNWAEHWLK